MKVSMHLEIALSLAAQEAQRRRHELMTVEHLLFALAHDQETARVIAKSGGNVERLKRTLAEVLDREMTAVPLDEDVVPTPSRGFQRVLQRAAWHVESSGKDELKGYNVLVAIFSEVDSYAVAALNDCGTSRYDVVSFISHGVTKDGSEPAREQEESRDDAAPAPEGGAEEGEQDALTKYALNLNERARAGDIETLVGREKELRRAIQVLARRRKNNPLFVGDAGVG